MQQQELIIYQGSDQPTEIQFIEEESQTFYDLSNVTEISACFKNEDGTELTKTMAGGSVSIINPASGIIKITWDEAETDALKVGKNISFFVVLKEGTDTIPVPFENTLTVKELKCG